MSVETARKWRVRFSTPDDCYTFVDITRGLPMPKEDALAWGEEQVRQVPQRYAAVASVYSIDHEDSV